MTRRKAVMRNIFCVIYVIYLVIMLAACSHNNINTDCIQNINSQLVVNFVNDDVYYCREMGQEKSQLIRYNEQMKHTTIDEGNYFSDIYSDNTDIYYSKYDYSTNNIEIKKYNPTIESEVLFKVPINTSNTYLKDCICVINNVIYFYHGGTLWKFDKNESNIIIDKISNLYINQSNIIYYKEDYLYINNLDCTDEKELFSINDLQKLIGKDYNTIRNIISINDKIYFIYSDEERSGIICSCDINGNDLASYSDNIIAEAFQITNGKIYVCGTTWDSTGKKVKGLLKLTGDGNISDIYYTIAYCYDRFFINNNYIYFMNTQFIRNGQFLESVDYKIYYMDDITKQIKPLSDNSE